MLSSQKNYTTTVKPVLTTTSEQRPPVNNDRPLSGPPKLVLNLPVNKGHLSTTASGRSKSASIQKLTCLQGPQINLFGIFSLNINCFELMFLPNYFFNYISTFELHLKQLKHAMFACCKWRITILC
jgi:hypothetical protein